MITISGNNEVLIENCKKLIECCDIRCSAESAGYLIDIWGSGLTATSFANGSIGVCGEVQSVAIEKKSRTGSVK
jgi:hypothetical protein